MLFILKYLILLVFIIFNFIYFKYNNNKGRAYCFLVSLTAKNRKQDYDGSLPNRFNDTML